MQNFHGQESEIQIWAKTFTIEEIINHGIIGAHRPPPKILSPTPKFRSTLDTKAPGPLLIYLVGLLAISDPHINIRVGPPNTCVALEQFNLLPLNTSV